MRRIRFLAFMVALFGGGFLLSTRVGTVSRLLGASESTRREFTAALVTTAYDPEGHTRTKEIATYAVRKDGSNVSLRKRFAQDGAGIQREVDGAEIVDVPGRRMVGVDHFTKSTSTSPLTDQLVAKYTNRPNAACTVIPNVSGATVQIGALDTLLGQRVVKITQDQQLQPSGHNIHFEIWHALDLDCFAVKTIATNTAADGRVSRVIMELTSLNISPPDSSVFAVPTTYTERPPSQIFAEADRLLGKTPSCTTCRAKTNGILDEAYNKRRARH